MASKTTFTTDDISTRRATPSLPIAHLSYLAPYWLISRNTITFHKYFWCWNCKGLPCNEKVSTIGTYRFHELKLLSFLDTPIRRGIISSGTRSFLTVTETLAGTLGGLKKHLTASIGTVELRILIRGCLQSDTDQYNTTADRWRNSHLL